MLRLSGLEEERLLQPIGEDTSEVAHEDNPCDFLHVPTEGNLLQAHDNNTSGRADDEHRTTHTSTVGEQLPEDAIDGQVACSLNGIHAHATSYERHIVDNAGEYTNDTGYEVVVALEGGVESLAQHGEYANFLQYGNSHEDAEEEHDGGEVDLGHDVADTLGHGVVLSGVVMEDFRSSPQDAQYQEDAHERWQMGEGLEDRYEDKTTYAQPKDDVALNLGKLGDIGLGQVLFLVELTLELQTEDKGWNEHGNQRWDEDFADNALSGDDALNP